MDCLPDEVLSLILTKSHDLDTLLATQAVCTRFRSNTSLQTSIQTHRDYDNYMSIPCTTLSILHSFHASFWLFHKHMKTLRSHDLDEETASHEPYSYTFLQRIVPRMVASLHCRQSRSFDYDKDTLRYLSTMMLDSESYSSVMNQYHGIFQQLHKTFRVNKLSIRDICGFLDSRNGSVFVDFIVQSNPWNEWNEQYAQGTQHEQLARTRTHKSNVFLPSKWMDRYSALLMECLQYVLTYRRRRHNTI